MYLIAGVRIDVQGGINAAGESGSRGIAHVSGGGGGGAGGMIGFDAPLITCNSLLLASGGGGGGGGSGPDDNPGGDGSDPSTTSAAGHGVGFVGNNSFGGNGGDGSVAIVFAPGERGLAGHLNASPGGGGGGGGGAGLISAPETGDLGTNLSPPRYTTEE